LSEWIRDGDEVSGECGWRGARDRGGKGRGNEAKSRRDWSIEVESGVKEKVVGREEGEREEAKGSKKLG